MTVSLIGVVFGLLGGAFFLCALLLLNRGGSIIRTQDRENAKLVASLNDLRTQLESKNSQIEKLAGLLVAANGIIQDYKVESINLNMIVEQQHQAILQNEALSGFLTEDPSIQELLNRKLKGIIRN